MMLSTMPYRGYERRRLPRQAEKISFCRFFWLRHADGPKLCFGAAGLIRDTPRLRATPGDTSMLSRLAEVEFAEDAMVIEVTA